VGKIVFLFTPSVYGKKNENITKQKKKESGDFVVHHSLLLFTDIILCYQ